MEQRLLHTICLRHFYALFWDGHGQHPKPKVGNDLRVFDILIFVPKWFPAYNGPILDRCWIFIIPPAQTCGAHIFRFLFILSNIDSIIEILCPFQAHICTTETLHFPEVIDSHQNWKPFELFTGRGVRSWSYGPCEQFGVVFLWHKKVGKTRKRLIA